MKKYRLIDFFLLILAGMIIYSCNYGLQTGNEVHISGETFDTYWDQKDVEILGDTLSIKHEGARITSKFKLMNFVFHADVMTRSGAEGQLMFHQVSNSVEEPGGYSVVINSSDYRSGNNQKSGSLSFIRNNFVRTTNDDEWFTLEVAVKANYITVMIDGKIISEYIEPENALRLEGKEAMTLSKGKVVVNKINSVGEILIRNIAIEALDRNLAEKTDSLFVNDSLAEMLSLLNQQGFPLIDYHGHLKGGLTIEEISHHGRVNGYNYGVAPNCGLYFPVTNDSTLLAYYNNMKPEPVFNAMQCEGREWVKLFSPEAVMNFDYIFTDAMTWTDHKGRRMRLWMPDEVVVEDEQKFMDMLTGKIEAIMYHEPVDIYVNPTFLPAELAPDYDRLWTSERMDRVIKALVDNDVALEINARYKIPSLGFIKKAKAAGVKFTFGTNNGSNNDLGRLEYCIQMIKEAGIEAHDMFIPKPVNSKKISEMGLPHEITG